MTSFQKGFGTAYETYLLRGIFDQIKQRYGIRDAIEYPHSGLLDGSILGSDVTSNNEQAHTADLVWSFCCFEQVEDSRTLIKEALEKTNEYLLLVIQNSRNPGVTLHWTYHKILGRPWDHGKIIRMRPSVLRRALTEMGLAVVEDGFFDLPWFVLDIYECGSFLRKLVPESMLDYRHTIMPSKFERMPRFVKSLLAHHYYTLTRKAN